MTRTWWLPEPRTEAAAWTVKVVAGVLLVGVPSLLGDLFLGAGSVMQSATPWLFAVMGVMWLLGLVLPFLYGLISPKPWAAPVVAGVVSLGFGFYYVYGPSREFSQGFEEAGGAGGFIVIMILVSMVVGAMFTAGVTLGGSFLGNHLRKKRAATPEPPAPPTLPSFERVP